MGKGSKADNLSEKTDVGGGHFEIQCPCKAIYKLSYPETGGSMGGFKVCKV